MKTLHIRAFGTPAPQGSKRHVGNGVMIESSKRVKPWRAAVVDAARAATEDRHWEPPAGSVYLTVTFLFPRPKSHFRTGRFAHLLKDSAPEWHCVKPDADKLTRAVFDALVDAGVLRDDCQVAELHVYKAYSAAEPAGARIHVADAPAAGRRRVVA